MNHRRELKNAEADIKRERKYLTDKILQAQKMSKFFPELEMKYLSSKKKKSLPAISRMLNTLK